RQPGTTCINVLGLAVGMGLCILILSYIRYESTFDRFHPGADRIFRVTATESYDGEVSHNAQAPSQLAALLPANFPGVEVAARVDSYNERVVSRGDKQFLESRNVVADVGTFEVFGMDLLVGNPESALRDPYSVVISETLARKYFDEANPLGAPLTVDRESYTVTGVMA